MLVKPQLSWITVTLALIGVDAALFISIFFSSYSISVTLCEAAFTVISSRSETLKTLDRERFVCERAVLNFTLKHAAIILI